MDWISNQMAAYCACDVVRRMARRLPEAVGVFSDRYNVEDLDSPEIRAMFIRHMNALDTLINLLEEPTVLMKQIEHVANKHAVIDGVKAKYFTVSLIYQAWGRERVVQG